MSSAETARRPVVQRRICGAGMALPLNNAMIVPEDTKKKTINPNFSYLCTLSFAKNNLNFVTFQTRNYLW